jgi:hypothetical protein
MESPNFNSSPIREQTKFLAELTALRVEYEKNMKRLYAAQADYMAAWRIVHQLIEVGAPDDLKIMVSYNYDDDNLCFHVFGQNCWRPGNILAALDRADLLKECSLYPSNTFEGLLDVVFTKHPLIRMVCPKHVESLLPELA